MCFIHFSKYSIFKYQLKIENTLFTRYFILILHLNVLSDIVIQLRYIIAFQIKVLSNFKQTIFEFTPI